MQSVLNESRYRFRPARKFVSEWSEKRCGTMETLVQGNYYRIARLVTRSINKILLVTHRTCLTTPSTRSTLLFTRSTCLIQP